MRILLVNFALRANQGGILQCYALQQVLCNMGHSVVKAELKRKFMFRISLHLLLAIPKRLLVRLFVTRNSTKVLHEFFEDRKEYLPRKNTDRFIKKYLNIIFVSSMDELRGEEYDAVIVGSDQVWRKLYTDRLLTNKSSSDNAFLAFTDGWHCRRIAYAASLGVDYWEYTDEETAVLRTLVHRFDAISVREDSAVPLLRNHLGDDLKIDHLLDPTLLLERNAYLKLIHETKAKPNDGQLLVYILDPSEFKKQIIDYYADKFQIKPFNVNNPDFENIRLSPKKRIQPPIGQWLRGFMDANYVVADSFHACVFSIIFEKPFTVIANSNRGISRISSLLHMFELEERMVFSEEDLPSVSLNINWQHVRQTHKAMSEKSYQWLKEALMGKSPFLNIE